MKRIEVIFTLNELKTIVPSITKEHLISELPHVRKIIKDMFFRLGCTVGDELEIIEGVTSRNRFNELDDSLRVTAYERLDEAHLRSKYASHQARLATNDIELMKDIDLMSNQRSYDMSDKV